MGRKGNTGRRTGVTGNGSEGRSRASRERHTLRIVRRKPNSSIRRRKGRQRRKVNLGRRGHGQHGQITGIKFDVMSKWNGEMQSLK